MPLAAESLVTLPLTFNAIGAAVPGAPFEPVTRTVNVLQADEALVKVSYASINPMDADVYYTNCVQLPLPMVLGFEFSGVVVALGTAGAYHAGGNPKAHEAEAITLGAAVFGLTFGVGWGGGAFGEYVVAKRERLILRGDVSEADACTYGIAYASVYDSLFLTTDISKRAGQTIFIPGGGGGVAHFAVQLCKAYGLRVITSASTLEGLELLRKLRADVVIDCSRQDVVVEVLTATEGRGADLVFDSTDVPGSMTQSAAVVAKGGRWIRLGSWKHDAPELHHAVETIVSSRGARVLIGDVGRYSLDPAYIKRVPMLSDGLRIAKQLYVEGRVKPYISETLPFDPSALQAAVQNSSAAVVVGTKVVKVTQTQ